MKKFLSILLITAMLCVCLSSCFCAPLIGNLSETNSEEPDNSGPIIDFGVSGLIPSESSEVPSESVDVPDKPITDNDDITEETLRFLVLDNQYCVKYIFTAETLPIFGDAVVDNIYQVDPSVFQDYQTFRDYLLTIYSEKYVDFLLSDYPYPGDPCYVNIDGMLCINADRMAAKGYYVNWDEPKIEIIESNDTYCTFTVTGTLEEPGEDPIGEDYSVTATAIYENGRWVLGSMFY